MVDDEPRSLTMKLIEECTAGGSTTGVAGSPEERAADLLKVEVLRLDWQRIARIQNLDIFTHLRELYLQHNRIHVIEELDTLQNLEFLALGSNRIRRLENLRHLRKLQVLDLSANAIEDIDTQELPPALVILNLTSNPCCLDPDFRQRVTSSLPALMALDEVPVVRSSRAAGVEECKGPTEGSELPLEDEREDGNGGVTLYVTVHSDGESHIVPFHFSPTGNTTQQLQQASRFCTENGLHGDDDKRNLAGQMEEAIAGLNAPHTSKGRPISKGERPSEEANRNRKGPDLNDPHETDGRLHAILRLQKARARAMEESTTSFEQHKKLLLAATRKLVEQKTAAAHGRSDALEEDISKARILRKQALVLEDARAELQLRRARVSAENRRFATDMREKVERVLADRRQESQSVVGARAVAISPK
ncbi:unnamed protein product [Ectocarpus fasciculatus]